MSFFNWSCLVKVVYSRTNVIWSAYVEKLETYVRFRDMDKLAERAVIQCLHDKSQVIKNINTDMVADFRHEKLH